MTNRTNLPDAPGTTLYEVIKSGVQWGMNQIHTSMPAVVVAYNPATQTISAQPTVQNKYYDPTLDMDVYEPFPVIPNIPVLFWQASGYSFTFPLTPGDPVTLFFGERSTDEWRATGNLTNLPQDARRFDMSDAVAVPGGLPGAIPATGYGAGMVLEGASIQLGSSGAVNFVALASLVLTQLQAIKNAYDVHTHSGVLVGAGVTGTPVVPMPAPGSVAATKVKAE